MDSQDEKDANGIIKLNIIETWIQGVLVLVCLSTNIASFAYIKLKLEINSRVAKILKFDTAFKIGFTSMSVIGFFRIIFLGHRDLNACSLGILPLVASFVGSYIFPAATSLIRLLTEN